jgi:hypothetical protein
MKKAFLLIIVGIALSSIITCSTTKKYIEIKGSDVVYEDSEKVKYEVLPGDKLEILSAENCRDGKGLCWKVRNVKTDEIGYVSADKMKVKHNVITIDTLNWK